MLEVQILSLIQAIENEEQSNAVEQIYKLYKNNMFVICLGILKHKENAEDALMSTFEYICSNPHLFVDYKKPATINLIKICTKCRATDIYRKVHKQRSMFVPINDDEDLHYIEDLSAIAINESNKELLADAMKTLESEDSAIISLRYYYQMKPAEIASMLHKDTKAVSTSLFDSKRKLHKALTEMGYTK